MNTDKIITEADGAPEPKLLGEMSPEERRAAIERARNKVQQELTAAAPEIERIMNDEPEPEPEPEPWHCPCYSCDGQCGCDSPDKSYRLTHRGPMCETCAEKTDVTDDDLTGVSARVSQDRVRLTVDTWGYGRSAWLDVEDVDALMVFLLNARFALAKERAENIAAEMRLAALRARADMATGS